MFYLWNLAALLLSSAGITVLSLLLGLGMFDIQFFFDYFRHPLIFLLNWIPVLLLQLFLYGATGRHWSAYLGTALLVLLASAGSFYKLRFRSEPFVFSDLAILGTALGVASDFDLTPNLRLVLAMAAIPAGTLFLLFFVRGRMRGTLRLPLCLATILAAGALWTGVYSDTDFYNNKAVSPDHVVARIWNEMIFVSKGSVYPFLHSIQTSLETAPEGYSREEAAQLLSAFSDAAIPEEKKVDLLVFQLESFCDFSLWDLEGLNPDTYALFHALEAESLSGELITNMQGGGTVNAERTLLTGSCTLGEYRHAAYSHVRYLNDQGYATLASHPHYGGFYSRIGVNENLGFDEFWYRENHYEQAVAPLSNHWMSDFLLFPEVLAQYREHAESGEHVFSFTVTAQGHGGYPHESYDGEPLYWTAPEGMEESSRAVNYFLSCLADTQVHLSATIDSLREEDRPVLVLVYGDHKPSFGALDFFEKAGVNMDCDTLEGFRNYYATRYLIWANDAAKELLGDDFIGEGPTLSPCFLLTLVFDKLGWEGSAFLQLNRSVMQRLPVITPNGYYLADGEWVTELDAEQAELLRQLEWVQYYVNYDASAYFRAFGKE